MTTVARGYAQETVEVAGRKVHLLKGGRGDPLLVLHHEIGNPGWLTFHEELARRFTVYVPSQPGYDKSELAPWMRSVRDLAIVNLWLLRDLKVGPVAAVGLGYGAWIAAEMATMCHHQLKAMALVGPMGIQPAQGEIMDQFLLSSIEYVKAGFHDQATFEQLFGREPSLDQLEVWEINREMTTRLAWKPYMFNQALPVLLPGVHAPALVVWGRQDRVVPLSCAQRYVEALPHAQLTVLDNCGHFVEIERPKELADLVLGFFTGKR